MHILMIVEKFSFIKKSTVIGIKVKEAACHSITVDVLNCNLV